MELSRTEGGGGDTGSRSPAQAHVVAVSGEDDDESTKRRDLLSRRPSYRKILNDLSSPNDKSDANDSESDTSVALKPQSILQAQVPSSLHTVTVLPQTIQIAAGQAEAQGLQTLTMTNANGAAQNQAGTTIVQYAQSADGQFFIPVAGNGVQAYQISTPTSLPQGVVMAAGASLGSPQPVGEEASRKRELRLLKNREAARECRRKKKDYVKCLENRVAVLENQNKQLIEELKSLKELYCQKESVTVPDGVTILQTTIQ